MSKGQKATKSASGDGGGFFCRACQRTFVDANALRRHCQSSKVHQQKQKFASHTPPPASKTITSTSKRPSASQPYKCSPCNRTFKSDTALQDHMRDSPKHRPSSGAPSTDSTNSARTSILEGNYDHLRPDYDRPRQATLRNASITGPELVKLRLVQTTADIFGTSNPVEYDAIRGLWIEREPHLIGIAPNVPFESDWLEYDELELEEEDEDEVEEEDTDSELNEILPYVPEPWSTIPLSERDVLLHSLEAQCHSTESLSAEHYWTQRPSPAEIDMTRKCNDCGAAKGKLSTDAAESVCRFHPAKKPFEVGIIRGRGRGASKYSRCINCPKVGNTGGCIVLAAHDFGAPDANLSEMTPTPVYNPIARKAVVLDCEMVGVLGANNRETSEVVRLSAVDFLTGEVLIDTYVSPKGHVISWRTKFSGVNASILREQKQRGNVIEGWKAARELVWHFIDAQTILIGHSLNNDLSVLGMVHTQVVDSAILTRVAVAEECQRHWALKILVQQFLNLEIQAGGSSGHDCLEDTFAAREVVLWCLRNPFKLWAWAANEQEIMAEKARKKEAERAETSPAT
ncbi:hypothetical protein BDV12DRAFT_173319 [Aspergillus spectabilis]